MDFHDYVEAVRRRWRFVTVCVLLGLAAAAAATVLLPRTYTATAQLFIATRDASSDDAYQGGLFTQQRVKSYTRIVTSPAVLDGVISELDLKTSPGRLAEKISAQAPLDTTLVDIRVTDASATRAQTIADATAVQFTKYLATIEGSSAGSPPLVKASVVGGNEPPSTPTSPRPTVNFALGLLAGLAIGVGGAVLRHSLDTTLRSVDDIGTRLGLNALGVVPPPNERRRHGSTRRTEALDQLRARLRFTTDSGFPGSVLIAGPSPEEGRTQTAVDVASSVARTGKQVVLVEADLRRPRLAAETGLRPAPGLADVLGADTPLHEAVQIWDEGRIRVLTSGRAPVDPGALISSAHMAQLVRTLEKEADLVVIDSPPLLPFADAAALASVAQGVLFVVRAGTTRRDDARRALETLAAVRAEVLGAVLTGTHAAGLTDWQPPDESGREPPRSRTDHAPEHERPGRDRSVPVTGGVIDARGGRFLARHHG
ncbi:MULTISPECIES: polysaccharide biosynthesis tyrosine autokinase [Streptomyces]|jgi:non-specific protein-tyrosine kinase|uniref:polysaccharide biosynthesis tyrosine autokinase n=1 Tax=Streptomyces TaxID=1883 RepID=UPI00104C504D|nr:polysaccharide biosynthesis tyrosine autokinase [Streptomyces sp. BK205]TCR20304.1 non-specific protein-tyrosine kinase [Streptomyces sp. BK205]